MKQCKTCGEIKEFHLFYKKTKTSYRSECKFCGDSRSKQWASENKIRRREIANKSAFKYKDKRVEASVRHQQKHPQKYLHTIARNRSIRDGIEFDIEINDIDIPKVCPIFKTPFVRGTPYSASLDKINPLLGYVKGNIQVISRKANTMKSNATKEELEQFANWIINNKELL